MNTTQAPEVLSSVEPPVSARAAPVQQTSAEEYVLRFIVIFLGIALGALAAGIIGLGIGWLEITC